MKAAAFLILILAAPAGATLPSGTTARLKSAEALEEKGESVAAGKIYESLLTAAAADPATHASILRALGRIAGQAGDYDAAIQRATAAAEEYRKLSDLVGEASSLNNLGVAQLYSGAYDAAGKSLEAAMALSRKADDREGQAEQSGNLSNVYYFQARYAEALETYGHALQITERSMGEPWAPRRKAVLLINMATVYQRLGQDLEAMDLYRRAREQRGVLRRNEDAQLLTNLGVLYRRMGDPYKALETYAQAGMLFARDRHHDGELTVLMNRGIVYALDLGQLDEAVRTFANARRLAHVGGSRRDEMQATLYSAETLYRKGDYNAARAGFEEARSVAAKLGTGEEEWKAIYGLARVAMRAGDEGTARSLLEQSIAKIESLRGRLKLVSLKSDFFADKREVYDALIALRLKNADPAEIFGYMERSRARTFQDRLRVAGPFTLDTLRATLDERTAVLETWLSPRGAAVLCATRKQVRILPAKVDAHAIEQLRISLAGGGEWRSSAATLAQAVMPPGSIPAEVRHVIVVADGALTAIPFEVLPYGTKLAIECFSISYLPAAALLIRKPANAPAGRLLWPWSESFAGFANPVFSSETMPGADPRMALVESAGEVRAIAGMLPGRSQLYIGAEDRKEFLTSKAVSGIPVLHLATHAAADAENPERSRIVFSPARGGGGAADYLFLNGVYDLDLGGVDLVTLSACETESGRVIRGEGVQGFSRAFLAGGARSVVATLWRVADTPTAEFMRDFYRDLSRRAGKAESLRLAKLRFLRLRNEASHPRYWAAFVLSGDALTPIPRAISWWWFIVPGLLLIALAAWCGARLCR